MAISRDSINFNLDLNSVFEGATAQFRGLDPKEPGQWPWLPKLGVCIGAGLAVVLVAYILVIMDASASLEQARAREPELKEQYRNKLAKAVARDELRKQKVQVEEYVNQLEKQLPSKADIEALLSDVTQAGLGRGLQFDFFRPNPVIVKDYYAELPISMRVTGSFHDLGAFAADIANLSRIVTLSGIVITVNPGSRDKDAASAVLSLETTARTYRYLDSGEQAKVKGAAGKPKGGA
jgi:type IV pilus assembly protein PilO